MPSGVLLASHTFLRKRPPPGHPAFPTLPSARTHTYTYPAFPTLLPTYLTYPTLPPSLRPRLVTHTTLPIFNNVARADNSLHPLLFDRPPLLLLRLLLPTTLDRPYTTIPPSPPPPTPPPTKSNISVALRLFLTHCNQLRLANQQPWKGKEEQEQDTNKHTHPHTDTHTHTHSYTPTHKKGRRVQQVPRFKNSLIPTAPFRKVTHLADPGVEPQTLCRLHRVITSNLEQLGSHCLGASLFCLFLLFSVFPFYSLLCISRECDSRGVCALLALRY